MGVDDFLNSLKTNKEPEASIEVKNQLDQWDVIIQPKGTYLLTGDVGTGKTGLACWIMERYSEKYGMLPAVVGFPRSKQNLLSPSFVIIDDIEECTSMENAIIFIDEAGLQLPLENTKQRETVTNFLSLPRQRKQILILSYHFPRLTLSRYLPFFNAFLLKRPPYLHEFASKGKNDTLSQMMQKAEERFAELTPPDWKPSAEQQHPLAVLKNVYVVAPRIRWQGLLTNPTASFWTQDLSEAWSCVGLDNKGDNNGTFNIDTLKGKPAISVMTTEERLQCYGVPPELHSRVVAMDMEFTLEELRTMCYKKGLPTSGDKKRLASLLILQGENNAEQGMDGSAGGKT